MLESMSVLHQPQSTWLAAWYFATAPKQVQHKGAEAWIVGIGSYDAQFELIYAINIVPVAPGMYKIVFVNQLNIDLHVSIEFTQHFRG